LENSFLKTLGDFPRVNSKPPLKPAKIQFLGNKVGTPGLGGFLRKVLWEEIGVPKII